MITRNYRVLKIIILLTALAFGFNCATTENGPGDPKGGKYRKIFSERYKDPRVSCRDTGVPGIMECSVWDGIYANEDPIIPSRYFVTGEKKAYEAARARLGELLAEVKFTVRNETDAVNAARLVAPATGNARIMDRDPASRELNGVPAQILAVITPPLAKKTPEGYKVTLYLLVKDDSRALFRRGPVTSSLERVSVTISGNNFTTTRETIWKEK